MHICETHISVLREQGDDWPRGSYTAIMSNRKQKGLNCWTQRDRRSLIQRLDNTNPQNSKPTIVIQYVKNRVSLKGVQTSSIDSSWDDSLVTGGSVKGLGWATWYWCGLGNKRGRKGCRRRVENRNSEGRGLWGRQGRSSCWLFPQLRSSRVPENNSNRKNYYLKTNKS